MSEVLNEADHELQTLLRFAAGLGVDDATVFEIHAIVCEEVREAGASEDEADFDTPLRRVAMPRNAASGKP